MNERDRPIRRIRGAAILLIALVGLSLASCSNGGGSREGVATPTTFPARETPMNATQLERDHGDHVVMVVAEMCNALGYAQGTGFAIDATHIVTNWHVVADDNEEPGSRIQGKPYIQTYGRGWYRGTVIAAHPELDLAVIELEPRELRFDTVFRWADTPTEDGQETAIMGYPGIEDGEFALTVADATQVDGTTRDIPSFGMTKALSARTGSGNSGGPVVNSDGEVLGMMTWGLGDLKHWWAIDAAAIREVVDADIADPDPSVGCTLADEDRSLRWAVRLGTFSDDGNPSEREAAIAPATPPGIDVTTVDSSDWAPFLLSDYPSVLLAGPFESEADAREAATAYQSALDSTGDEDQLVTTLFPEGAFTLGAGRLDCAPGFEAGAPVTEVTGVSYDDPLVLRADPSVDAPQVEELFDGDRVFPTSDDPVEADGVTWIHVGIYGNTCGWIAQRFTKAAPG